jgi:hypothetical protein
MHSFIIQQIGLNFMVACFEVFFLAVYFLALFQIFKTYSLSIAKRYNLLRHASGAPILLPYKYYIYITSFKLQAATPYNLLLATLST